MDYLNSLKRIIKDFEIKNDQILIEGIEEFDGKKLSIAFSYQSSKMISIELLEDGTCDLMVVDIKSEEPLFFETKYFNRIEDLNHEISYFLNNLDM
ncbi:MAG: hypothetical protein Sapg2KO_53760 [Saprospiraceae bacterium]